MGYELFLVPEPIIENEDFIVHANSSIITFAKDMMKYLLEQKKIILDFFGIDRFRKIQINLYDTKESYINFTSQFFKPSSFSTGNFAMGMLNIYINKDDLSENFKYEYKIRTVAHEFVHVVYSETVQEEGENKRVAWLDEGLAGYLSGQRAILNDINDFKKFFLARIIGDNNKIPNIEFLQKSGENFGKYNGYNLSYLIIRYLDETISRDEFQKLIRSKFLIDKLGQNILLEAISHYKNQFDFVP